MSINHNPTLGHGFEEVAPIDIAVVEEIKKLKRLVQEGVGADFG